MVYLILIASVDSIKLGKRIKILDFWGRKRKKMHRSLHDFVYRVDTFDRDCPILSQLKKKLGLLV